MIHNVYARVVVVETGDAAKLAKYFENAVSENLEPQELEVEVIVGEPFDNTDEVEINFLSNLPARMIDARLAEIFGEQPDLLDVVIGVD